MLTKRQKQILDFIKLFQKKRGYSPSLEEIKKHLRLSAVSTVHHHIKSLEDFGYLSKEDNQPRAIELYEKEPMVQVPLTGTITAGQPIEAVEERELIAVPKNKLPRSGDVFALRVAGESMIEENINDGDLVLVKRQSTAENGQKVVALIDNYEATLKKFYQKGNQLILQPANRNLEPIVIDNGNELAIQGVVIDVIKKTLPNFDVVPYAGRVLDKKKSKNVASFENKVIEGDCLDRKSVV